MITMKVLQPSCSEEVLCREQGRDTWQLAGSSRAVKILANGCGCWMTTANAVPWKKNHWVKSSKTAFYKVNRLWGCRKKCCCTAPRCNAFKCFSQTRSPLDLNSENSRSQAHTSLKLLDICSPVLFLNDTLSPDSSNKPQQTEIK